MSKPVAKWPKRLAAHERSSTGDIEISTLAKWVLLVIFLILVIIILAKVLSTGEDKINFLCELTGGWIGC
jgi:hypothetical protein